ncbi:hypothetical protein EUGRSUZ_L01965 [Eucalyptus grandis]|uniref:rRNA biogenesis protein RRP36 n=1 Tax=Eucalyptus grandis TaxID=71139 RepID=A0A058ZU25_EUCGR|nr:hypothetical protein EUGRSUZ_L01965 [Eucalyptus grandis]
MIERRLQAKQSSMIVKKANCLPQKMLGEIERELADVTFEELQKARSDGSHSVYKKPNEEKKPKRANKNRPMEASWKKPVGRFREVIQAPKKVARDPRFESLCGTLNVEGFKKRYGFLYENELPAERKELQKQLKKSNDPDVIDELKSQIGWIVSPFLNAEI